MSAGADVGAAGIDRAGVPRAWRLAFVVLATVAGGLALAFVGAMFVLGDRYMATALAVGGATVITACVVVVRRRDPEVALVAPMTRTAPGLVFHACLVPPTVLVLVADSVPGSVLLPWLLGAAALLALAAVWSVRLLVYLVSVVRRQTVGSVLPFLVAPLGLAAIVGLVAADAPFRARWAVSVDDLDAFVASAPHGTVQPEPDGDGDVLGEGDGDSLEWQTLDAPDWVGAFLIHRAARVGEAVILYESTGGFIDSVGFAHLPDGPDPALENGLFEDPTFRHIEGDWYEFSAGW